MKFKTDRTFREIIRDTGPLGVMVILVVVGMILGMLVFGISRLLLRP